MNYSFEFYTESFAISNEDDLIRINFSIPGNQSVYICKDEIESLIDVLTKARDIMYSKKNNAE